MSAFFLKCRKMPEMENDTFFPVLPENDIIFPRIVEKNDENDGVSPEMSENNGK